MKTLNRELSTNEKILLGILVIIIVAAAYYLAVFRPVSESLKQSKIEKTNLEEELMLTEARAMQISDMKDEVGRMEKSGHVMSGMPSYNAGKQEIDFLNSTLAEETSDYYVGFTQITRESNQIRRNFSLSFSADNYAAAEKIIDSLENSDIRCLIGDMVVVPGDDEEELFSGPVEVNCVATFYETMYGGVEDSDLPEDSAKAE